MPHSSSNYGRMRPGIASIVRNMLEPSLHRLPDGERQQDLIEILEKYIESNGENTEAKIYLERSSFIQSLIKRTYRANKTCTTENLQSIFAYLQAQEKDFILIDRLVLQNNDPVRLFDFIGMHMNEQLKTNTDWKLLFGVLEHWDIVDSKAWPNYNGYAICTYAQSFLIPNTQSLVLDISGGYTKILYDGERYYYGEDDFTESNMVSLFGRQTQDQEYIAEYLAYLAKESKMDIFSLLNVDPTDVQEWLEEEKKQQ